MNETIRYLTKTVLGSLLLLLIGSFIAGGLSGLGMAMVVVSGIVLAASSVSLLVAIFSEKERKSSEYEDQKWKKP